MCLRCRETAVTVVTASVHDAVPTKYWDHAWGRQVRKENCAHSYENKQSFSSSVLNFSFFFSLAPEAQRETVFVCAACNSFLIKLQWDASSLFRPESWILTHAVVFMSLSLSRFFPCWSIVPVSCLHHPPELFILLTGHLLYFVTYLVV